MEKIIEIKEKRMFNYDLSALQREIDDAINLKKRLSEDLRYCCIDIREVHRDWNNYNEKDREKFGHELNSLEEKRKYLEDILGFTYKLKTKSRESDKTTYLEWVKAEI